MEMLLMYLETIIMLSQEVEPLEKEFSFGIWETYQVLWKTCLGKFYKMGMSTTQSLMLSDLFHSKTWLLLEPLMTLQPSVSTRRLVMSLRPSRGYQNHATLLMYHMIARWCASATPLELFTSRMSTMEVEWDEVVEFWFLRETWYENKRGSRIPI